MHRKKPDDRIMNKSFILLSYAYLLIPPTFPLCHVLNLYKKGVKDSDLFDLLKIELSKISKVYANARKKYYND